MPPRDGPRAGLAALVLGAVLAVLLAGLALAASSLANPTAVRSGADAPNSTSAAVPAPGPQSVVGPPAGEACSAGALGAPGPPAGDLPATVIARLADIADAARACDIDRLAGFVGPQFLANFDDVAPAEHWRAAEARGEEPLRYLVLLLETGHSVVVLEDGRELYLWPAAITHPSWSDVTDEERRDLAGIYPSAELARFEQADRYIGYRLGIAEDGEWQLFVTGQR